jgi:hypothetical protein
MAFDTGHTDHSGRMGPLSRTVVPLLLALLYGLSSPAWPDDSRDALAPRTSA